MGPMLSNNTTSSATPMSGLFKSRQTALPKLLKYPNLSPLTDVAKHLNNKLCYIIRHYDRDGISVLVARKPKLDEVTVLCGDWNGNVLDLLASDRLNVIALAFIKDSLESFLGLMRLIKLEQAQFFFACVDDQLILVDVQISLDKMAGPGLLQDVFGKIYRTQEVLKIETVNDQVIDNVKKGHGTYAGNLVIKPSKFYTRTLASGAIAPLYAEIIK